MPPFSCQGLLWPGGGKTSCQDQTRHRSGKHLSSSEAENLSTTSYTILTFLDIWPSLQGMTETTQSEACTKLVPLSTSGLGFWRVSDDHRFMNTIKQSAWPFACKTFYNQMVAILKYVKLRPVSTI